MQTAIQRKSMVELNRNHDNEMKNISAISKAQASINARNNMNSPNNLHII